MRIIIIGEGKLGIALSERLIAEKHDVVVIDTSQDVLSRNEDRMDALFIRGNGVSLETLSEAEARRADVVISTTASDETNMLACLTAKRLGAQYTIARIRDPQYLGSLPFLQKELAIDSVINPERATAREISRILRYPYADNIETFARGRVEMMDFKAGEDDPVVNIPLKDMYRINKNLPRVLFCAIERGEEAIIPKGDFVILPGDQVHVMADVASITAFFKALGKDYVHIKKVMVMGGSRIAFYLARMLLDMNIAVSIIEMDEDKARYLSEELPKAEIIHGDGMDQELLLSEGIQETDALITLSGRDEDNLLCGLFAVQNGVKKVIIKNDRYNYSGIIGKVGLSSVVSPLSITCDTIMRSVRARISRSDDCIRLMYRLMNGKAEALEFIADRNDDYIDIPLKDLEVAPDCLVGVIVRDNNIMIPFGNDKIEPGDTVIVISKAERIHSLKQILGVRK